MSRLIEDSEMGYIYPNMKKRRGLIPWSIQVELHEGCDKRCWFCGINTHYATGHQERAKADSGRDISLDLLRKIFREFNDWLTRLRVEINSHGEPCLHPEWQECLKIMSEEFPGASLVVQTNCKSWADDDPEGFMRESFASGLDGFVLNCYDLEYYDFFKAKLPEWDMPFVDYYYDNPDHISGNSYYKRKGDVGRVILWKDLGVMNEQGEVYKLKRINKRLHNSAGNGDIDLITKHTGHEPLSLPRKVRCSKVHREIILGWDGVIPICCQDWRDQFIMGDCNKSDIRDIWYSPRWWVVRQALYRRRRDLFVPCHWCDDPTTRTGLDKDPGLDLTDEECEVVVKYTQSAGWGTAPLVSSYQKAGEKMSPFYG